MLETTHCPLLFWMFEPSIHRAGMIDALVRKWQIPIKIMTEYDISERRKNLGWPIPTFGRSELLIAPDWNKRQAILDQHSDSNSIHIFCGMTAYPNKYKVMKKLRDSPAIIGILSEPANTMNFFWDKANRLHYFLRGLFWRNRIKIILGYLDKVERTRTGKLRFVVSELADGKLDSQALKSEVGT